MVLGKKHGTSYLLYTRIMTDTTLLQVCSHTWMMAQPLSVMASTILMMAAMWNSAKRCLS